MARLHLHQNGVPLFFQGPIVRSSRHYPSYLPGRLVTISCVLTRFLAENLQPQNCSEGEQPVDTLHLDKSKQKSFGRSVAYYTLLEEFIPYI